MGSIFDLIRQWARDRNLVEGSNPQAQMLKLFEEGGELAHAIARNNYDGVMDSIGDMVVVLTILAAQFDANIEEDCIAPAYDTIKDRKGRMVDGVFVKEESVGRIATPEELAKFNAVRDALNSNEVPTPDTVIEVKTDDWIPHDGGPMPCDGDTWVNVRFRNGFETKGGYRASPLRWDFCNNNYDYDIVAWREVDKLIEAEKSKGGA